MLSVDKLVNKYCPWVVPERISLTHLLYETMQEIKESEENFAQFYNWGNKLLDDFDLLDKNLVPADKLFKTIDDIEAIKEQFDFLEDDARQLIEEFWGKALQAKNKNEEQAWTETWKNSGELYFAFTIKLKKNGLAYPGMKYRYLAENLDLLEEWKSCPVIIAGFNRLSASEEAILDYLKHADFFWDMDNYYYRDSTHLAGKYLRKLISPDKMQNEPSDFLEERDKEISVLNLSKSHSQAQIAMEFMAEKGWKPEETMLVLADESQLIPLLTVVPEDIEKLNVSMGWHVSESPVATLIDHILELHVDYDEEHRCYPSLRGLNLLRHNYVRQLNPKRADAFKAEKEWTRLEDLKDYGRIYEVIFKPLGENVEIFDRLIALVEELYRAEKDLARVEDEDEVYLRGSGVFLAEILKYIHQKLLRLRDIFQPLSASVNLRELTYLFRQIFRSTRIPFSGEPLSGMQILGPLEARSLDFDNVIVFNMREGTWPPDFKESTIPYSLKKAYGMPVIEDEIAEYSYYFWSLIARTQNVLLLNPDDTAAFNAKGKSRFLLELDTLKEHFDNYTVRNVEQDLQVKEEREIIIEKDEAIMEKIKSLDHFSASSLLDYTQCSLKFYFSKIVGLKESEKFDPEYNAAKFGTAFHNTMEKLYKPYSIEEGSGEAITETVIDKLKNEKESIVKEMYKEEFKLQDYELEKGRHLFYIDELNSYVDNVLDYDKKRVPFQVKACEKEFYKDFDYADGESVKIKGYIDRIDIKGDTIYIIDYKTGKVKYSKVGDGIFTEDKIDSKGRNILQVLLYAYIMDEGKQIEPQLFGVRDVIELDAIDGPTLYLKKYGRDTSKDKEYTRSVVEEGFSEQITELFDPDVPFEKTENEKHCEYCAFRFMCGR